MGFSKRPALERDFWRGSSRFAQVTLFLTMCWLQPARGQVAASIKGVVTDSSGAPVVSATVTAKSTETAAVRTTVTDDVGRYQIVSLGIGGDEVAASKSV